MSTELRIKKIIAKYLPDDNFKEVLEYSLFPAGKLFRSKLAIAMSEDLSYNDESIYGLCAAIECHHTYSLIHDDLPCMDDDDYRRGKLSSHKKFNEALAVLAGDSLLNLSYEIISDIESIKSIRIIKLMSSLCGPRGLILGQVMDLRGAKNTLSDTLRLHALKTSNLMEVALGSANILAGEKLAASDVCLLAKHVGVVFQLIDDLLDLGANISEREKEINPFIRFKSDEVFKELNSSMQKVFDLTKERELMSVQNVLELYLKNMKEKLNKTKIEAYLEKLDIPIMGF